MNLKNKIKREQRQLKIFAKMKKVGTIIAIVGAVIFTVSSIVNLITLFEKCYDGATNTKIFFAIFFFVIKELWASNALRVGLFMLIMFSSFVNKKKLNIERFENELVQPVAVESEVIDIK